MSSPAPSRSLDAIMARLYAGIDNDDDEDISEATDEDMPPLEETDTFAASSNDGSPASATTTTTSSDPYLEATRRINRRLQEEPPRGMVAFRFQPATSMGGTTTNGAGGVSNYETAVAGPFAAAAAAYGANNNTTTSVNAAARNGEDEDDDGEDNENNNVGDQNKNRFAALQASDSDDGDDDNDEEEDLDDEVLSYYEDEEDYDDVSIDEEDSEEQGGEDDDEDDENSSGMPAGLIDFFRALTNVVEDQDADGDAGNGDDDDESDCNCPRCWMVRFGLHDDDEDEEDDIYSTLDDSEVVDPIASPCAICMEPETTRRKFVCLPCCGGIAVESTSSTRFCQSCVVQYMARTGNGVPQDDATSNASASGSSSKSSLVGECPRCKRLLVLKENNSTTVDQKKVPFYQRTHLVPANAHQYHWYIGRMDGGHYRVYLLTLAWCDAKFIPEELLLNDSGSADRIAHLCQWGILDRVKLPPPNRQNRRTTTTAAAVASALTPSCLRVYTTNLSDKFHNLMHRLLPSIIADPESTHLPNQSGNVYTVSPTVQMELRNLLVSHLEMDEDWGLRLSRVDLDEPGNDSKQSFMVACNCAASAFMAISKLRVVRATRLINRGLTLALTSFNRLLPSITKWPTDLKKHSACWHAATILNVVLFSFCLQILVKAFWIGLILGKAFGVLKLFAAYFVPPEETWKRRVRDGTVFGLSFYFCLIPLFFWYRSWTNDEVEAIITDDAVNADSIVGNLESIVKAGPLSEDNFSAISEVTLAAAGQEEF